MHLTNGIKENVIISLGDSCIVFRSSTAYVTAARYLGHQLHHINDTRLQIVFDIEIYD